MVETARLDNPIVLIHGLFGFNRIGLGSWTLAQYFKGIPEAMRQAGNRVFAPQLSPVGKVERRAAQLLDYLRSQIGDEPVHIFAHSMGGLDSRFLITRLEQGRRVLSLTTLGTPHRGTVVADSGIGWIPGSEWLRWSLKRVGFHPEAIEELTRESMARFNERTPDIAGVVYRSVAGDFHPDWKNRIFLLPHRYVTFPLLQSHEGPNDGMVSVASANWGQTQETWKADHFNLVNWNVLKEDPEGVHPDRVPDYLRLVGELKKLGY